MALPVVDQPFERVGIDLIEPLPWMKAGHHCMQTIVDCGIWSPEAIPLCQTVCQIIVAEWLTIFSIVGVPKELLPLSSTPHDNHIKELYTLLGVKLI